MEVRKIGRAVDLGVMKGMDTFKRFKASYLGRLETVQGNKYKDVAAKFITLYRAVHAYQKNEGRDSHAKVSKAIKVQEASPVHKSADKEKVYDAERQEANPDTNKEHKKKKQKKTGESSQ
jgi:hypothetical protein